MNFIVQDLARGSVVYGLPDPSGKARPMVLLQDVRANGRATYGEPINTFFIGSECHNRFCIPIKLRWKSENRLSFIHVLHAEHFSASEVLKNRTTFIGVLSSDILDAACKIYSTYIRGEDLDEAGKDARKMQIEFLKENPDVPYIDYRNSLGEVVRLYPDGEEKVVQTVEDAFADNSENSEIEDRDEDQFTPNRYSKPVMRRKPTNDDNPTIIVAQSKKAPLEKHIMPLTDAANGTMWIHRRSAKKQTNGALIRFLHDVSRFSYADLSKIYGCSTRSIYSIKRKCFDELLSRYNASQINLTDEEVGILLDIEKRPRKSRSTRSTSV